MKKINKNIDPFNDLTDYLKPEEPSGNFESSVMSSLKPVVIPEHTPYKSPVSPIFKILFGIFFVMLFASIFITDKQDQKINNIFGSGQFSLNDILNSVLSSNLLAGERLFSIYIPALMLSVFMLFVADLFISNTINSHHKHN